MWKFLFKFFNGHQKKNDADVCVRSKYKDICRRLDQQECVIRENIGQVINRSLELKKELKEDE